MFERTVSLLKRWVSPRPPEEERRVRVRYPANLETTLEPINGVAAVPIMAMIMHMGSRPAVMGQFTLTKWLKVSGWLATAIMAAAAAGMVATWGS